MHPLRLATLSYHWQQCQRFVVMPFRAALQARVLPGPQALPEQRPQLRDRSPVRA